MVNVHGYIDRIEDGKMVIIAETAGREFIVDETLYTGMSAGDSIVITIGINGVITDIQTDESATHVRRKRIEQLKKSLKRRQRG